MWFVILFDVQGILYEKDIEIHVKSTYKELRKIIQRNENKKYPVHYWFVTERKTIAGSNSLLRIFAHGKDIPDNDDFIRSSKGDKK